MQRSKGFAVVLLLGVFIAGIAIGFAGDRVIGHHRPGRHGPRSEVERMARELDLNASQRAVFDSILDGRRKQMRQLFAPIRPQMDSLMKIGKAMGDSTHQQLRRVLNAAQREKFDRMHAEAMKRGADARARWSSDQTREKPQP